ncbi:tetratricopeptide repeat protein [Candidatus Auribacterota bacterium]
MHFSTHRIERRLKDIGHNISYRTNVFFNFTLGRFIKLYKLPVKGYHFIKGDVLHTETRIKSKYRTLPIILKIIVIAALFMITACGTYFGARFLIHTTEERLEHHYTRGEKYFKDGKYPEAGIEFRNALQIAPRNINARIYLAFVDLYFCRLNEAFKELSKCIQINPNNKNAALAINAVGKLLKDSKFSRWKEEIPVKGKSDYIHGRTMVAKVYHYSGNTNEALKEAEKVYEISPEMPEINILLGDLYFGKRDFVKARAYYENAIESQGDSFEAYFKLGQHYIYDSDFKKAAIAFEKAAEISPDKPVVYLVTGDCYAYLNDYDHALKNYKMAYDTDDTYIKALKKICNLLVFRGKIGEAEPYINEFAKKAPDDPFSLLHRGILRFSNNRPEEAISDVRDSIKKSDGSLLHYFTLGRMLMQTGKYDEARDAFLEAIKIDSRVIDPHIELIEIYLKTNRIRKAREQAEKVLRHNTANYRANIALGKICLMENDFESAKIYLDKAAQASPDKPEAYFLLGRMHERQRNIITAIRTYIKSLGSDMSFFPSFNRLIDIYMATSNHKQALDLSKRMIRANPKNALVYQKLGAILTRLKNYDEAIKAYERALDNNPGLIKPRLGLINLYLGMNMKMNALVLCNEIIKTMPNNPDILSKIGAIYHSKGDTDKALEYYERAIGIKFNYVLANNLAWLYADLGIKMERALELAEQAEKASHYSPKVSDTVGWIKYKMGHIDGALEQFKKAATREPRNPSFRYHLALALTKKGDNKNAIRMLEKAFEFSTNFPEADKARKLLREIKPLDIPEDSGPRKKPDTKPQEGTE